MTQIQDLTAEIRRLCTEKGWREEPGRGDREGPWVAAYIALAHSELSEALDAYREKCWSETAPSVQADGLNGKPIGVGPELADVLIRVLDMCDIWDIDIEYEVKRVLAYGWTRPYQHGGRTL